jgi:hypothetical protein
MTKTLLAGSVLAISLAVPVTLPIWAHALSATLPQG